MELIRLFALRDFKVRYKNPWFGLFWILFQPTAASLIFSSIFSGLLQGRAEFSGHFAATYLGVSVWLFISRVVNVSSTCFFTYWDVVLNVSFNRRAIPFATVLASFADFVVYLIPFFVGVAFTSGFHASLLQMPFFLLALLAFAAGLSLFLSILEVHFRDLRYVRPFLMQLWFVVTPVAYLTHWTPKNIHFALALNPLTTIIDGLRVACAGETYAVTTNTLVSAGVIALVFLGGVTLFSFQQDTLAERVT